MWLSTVYRIKHSLMLPIIFRISGMVEKLCTHYGEEICKHDGITYYAFPEVDNLAEGKV